jgi:predicted DsbA family dithiol-disulfide isomerase
MQKVTVNMVSDVVCPWCIVGYQRLQEAIKTLDDIEVDIKFHPFELNPNMPEEGQNLREHIMEKYGIGAEQSAQNRARLVEAGKDVGFVLHQCHISPLYAHVSSVLLQACLGLARRGET